MLKFRFLTPPPDYLAINETSGKIYTNGRIDRDVLCRGLEHCRIREDIAVQPIQYFQIIKIVVEIIDINDNRPIFVPDQLVHEMSEASAVGSGFVIPTARDSDFGLLGIQRYRLITREAADDKLFTIQVRITTASHLKSSLKGGVCEVSLKRLKRDSQTRVNISYHSKHIGPGQRYYIPR